MCAPCYASRHRPPFDHERKVTSELQAAALLFKSFDRQTVSSNSVESQVLLVGKLPLSGREVLTRVSCRNKLCQFSWQALEPAMLQTMVNYDSVHCKSHASKRLPAESQRQECTRMTTATATMTKWVKEISGQFILQSMLSSREKRKHGKSGVPRQRASTATKAKIPFLTILFMIMSAMTRVVVGATTAAFVVTQTSKKCHVAPSPSLLWRNVYNHRVSDEINAKKRCLLSNLRMMDDDFSDGGFLDGTGGGGSFGDDMDTGGVMLDDLNWRVEKLRLEEQNTKRFLKAKPRFLPYADCRKWVQAWSRWNSKEDWVNWIAMGEKRNSYIPSRPDEYYGELGQWISWDHFLGIEKEEEENGNNEDA